MLTEPPPTPATPDADRSGRDLSLTVLPEFADLGVSLTAPPMQAASTSRVSSVWSRPVQWINVLVLVGAASTLSAGCAASGTTAGKPSATPLSNIVPSPTGPTTLGDVKLSPSPGTDASLVENLKYDLRVETIKMAYAMGKTSATCNKKHLQVEPGATVKCTVPTRCPRPLERPDQGPGHNARSGRVHR